MDMHKHHARILAALHAELKPVFDGSKQAVYLYLDDVHLASNTRFASMLGYASSAALRGVKRGFLDAFVAPGSQRALADAYGAAMERKVGSVVSVTWKKKSGARVKSKVMLVPVSYRGHLFALHFIKAA